MGNSASFEELEASNNNNNQERREEYSSTLDDGVVAADLSTNFSSEDYHRASSPQLYREEARFVLDNSTSISHHDADEEDDHIDENDDANSGAAYDDKDERDSSSSHNSGGDRYDDWRLAEGTTYHTINASFSREEEEDAVLRLLEKTVKHQPRLKYTNKNHRLTASSTSSKQSQHQQQQQPSVVESSSSFSNYFFTKEDDATEPNNALMSEMSFCSASSSVCPVPSPNNNDPLFLASCGVVANSVVDTLEEQHDAFLFPNKQHLHGGTSAAASIQSRSADAYSASAAEGSQARPIFVEDADHLSSSHRTMVTAATSSTNSTTNEEEHEDSLTTTTRTAAEQTAPEEKKRAMSVALSKDIPDDVFPASASECFLLPSQNHDITTATDKQRPATMRSTTLMHMQAAPTPVIGNHARTSSAPTLPSWCSSHDTPSTRMIGNGTPSHHRATTSSVSVSASTATLSTSSCTSATSSQLAGMSMYPPPPLPPPPPPAAAAVVKQSPMDQSAASSSYYHGPPPAPDALMPCHKKKKNKSKKSNKKKKPTPDPFQPSNNHNNSMTTKSSSSSPPSVAAAAAFGKIMASMTEKKSSTSCASTAASTTATPSAMPSSTRTDSQSRRDLDFLQFDNETHNSSLQGKVEQQQPIMVDVVMHHHHHHHHDMAQPPLALKAAGVSCDATIPRVGEGAVKSIAPTSNNSNEQQQQEQLTSSSASISPPPPVALQNGAEDDRVGVTNPHNSTKGQSSSAHVTEESSSSSQYQNSGNQNDPIEIPCEDQESAKMFSFAHVPSQDEDDGEEAVAETNGNNDDDDKVDDSMAQTGHHAVVDEEDDNENDDPRGVYFPTVNEQQKVEPVGGTPDNDDEPELNPNRRDIRAGSTVPVVNLDEDQMMETATAEDEIDTESNHDNIDLSFVDQYESFFNAFLWQSADLLTRNPEFIATLRVAKLQKLLQVNMDREAALEMELERLKCKKQEMVQSYQAKLIEASRFKAAREIHLQQELTTIEQATLVMEGRLTWDIMTRCDQRAKQQQLAQELLQQQQLQAAVDPEDSEGESPLQQQQRRLTSLLPDSPETQGIRGAIMAPPPDETSRPLSKAEECDLRQFQVDNALLKTEINVMEKKLAYKKVSAKKHAWVDSVFLRMDDKRMNRLKGRYQKKLGVTF